MEPYDIQDLQRAILYVMRNTYPRILQVDVKRGAGISNECWRRLMKSRDTSTEELLWFIGQAGLDEHRVITRARIYQSEREAEAIVRSEEP